MKHLAQIKEPYFKKNKKMNSTTMMSTLTEWNAPRESTREKQWKEKGVLQCA